MIIIHDHDPRWAAEYEAVRSSLLEALGPLALRVDHIGSTSVPGLGAKDVIDVQVTVRALSAEIRMRLVDAGYTWHAQLGEDHVPPGQVDDPDLWAKSTFTQPEGRRRANVHVRVDGKPNQRYALLFRDYLRAHPDQVRTIERIKREIARHHAEDRDAYDAIKDPVYDLVWYAARDWAEQTGRTITGGSA